jgi:hypothetical protein
MGYGGYAGGYGFPDASFNIGRIPFAYGPESIEHAGRTMVISGHLQEASLKKTLHYRDQLLEYAASPCCVLPVWWDAGTSEVLPVGWANLNGWYRVIAVNCNMLSYVDTGLAEFVIELEHIGARDNVDWVTITTSSYRDAEFTSSRYRTMFYSHGTRYTMDGPHTPASDNEPFGVQLPEDYPAVQWNVDPEKYLNNTSSVPLLEVDGLPVVGLHMPLNYTTWSLDSNLFKIESLDSTNLGWVCTHRDGDQFTVTGHTALSAVATASERAGESIEILHNSPAEVVLRQHMNSNLGGYIDVRMRRGAAGATFTRRSEWPFYDFILAFPAQGATTTLGHIYAPPTTTGSNTYSWTFWGFNTEWVFAPGNGLGDIARVFANPPDILTWGLFFSTSTSGAPDALKRKFGIERQYGNVTYMRDKAVRR